MGGFYPIWCLRVKKRVAERQCEASKVLLYLHNPQALKEDKKFVKNFCITLLVRLDSRPSPIEPSALYDENNAKQLSPTSINITTTMEIRLHEALAASTTVASVHLN